MSRKSKKNFLTVDPQLLFPTVEPGKEHQQASYTDFGTRSEIDGYYRESELARGGQGTLYIVRKGASKHVLKLYREGYAGNEDIRSLLRTAESSNLAPFEDYGFSEGTYYEVFPYYSGGTLRDMIENGTCSRNFILNTLLPGIFSALSAMHGRGVLHGDLKPENIMITDKGRKVILGDFGVATILPRALRSGGSIESDFRGTKEYAPAIRRSGDKISLSFSYDYGALGLILYEAYTGTRPIEDGLTFDERDSALLRLERSNLPGSITTEGERVLVAGLLRTNENERFGERELRYFLEQHNGGSGRSRGRGRNRGSLRGVRAPSYELGYVPETRTRLMIDNLEELLEKCEKYWDIGREAAHTERSDKLRSFVARNSDAEFAAKLLPRFDTRSPDYRLFSLIDSLRLRLHGSDDRRVAYRGVIYPSIVALLQAIEKGEASNGEALLNEGMLENYLSSRRYDDGVVTEVRRINATKMNTAEKIRVILRLIGVDSAQLIVHGKALETLEDLARAVVELSETEILELIGFDVFGPWMYQRKGNKILKEIGKFDELKN